VGHRIASSARAYRNTDADDREATLLVGGDDDHGDVTDVDVVRFRPGSA